MRLFFITLLSFAVPATLFGQEAEYRGQSEATGQVVFSTGINVTYEIIDEQDSAGGGGPASALAFSDGDFFRPTTLTSGDSFSLFGFAEGEANFDEVSSSGVARGRFNIENTTTNEQTFSALFDYELFVNSVGFLPSEASTTALFEVVRDSESLLSESVQSSLVMGGGMMELRETFTIDSTLGGNQSLSLDLATIAFGSADVAQVPEPSSMLTLFALTAYYTTRRRRRK